ncbi:MAG: N-acetylneuraminate synthase [Osedax symbiont Rs1]|nr:MAG: N-acetylneuraminate synthase [Osedax symbiont Rs1]
MKNKVLIIAEAGVNHNGQIELAKKLIDVAVSAGADIVKFQTFKTENIVTEKAELADYQRENIGSTDSQFTMLKRLELKYEDHFELLDYCHTKGIEFLSTAFDSESLEFLTEELGLTTLKIPSGEITNGPFLLEHAKKKLNIIMSTGMATLAEIEFALSVLAFGFTNIDDTPSETDLLAAYCSKNGKEALKRYVTILHCTTQYPAPFMDINLNVIPSLLNSFKLNVGYSDHSKGIEISIAAVAKGAVIIEKHFTLSNSMEGPDHKASLEPSQLKAMVTSIRNVEQALGDGIKAPQPSEVKNKIAARKSLVATVDIKIGEVFTKQNLSIMRPGNGMNPSCYWKLINNLSRNAYLKGSLINE